MTANRRRLNPFVRIISFILLVSFIAQDIVWANPDIISNDTDFLLLVNNRQEKKIVNIRFGSFIFLSFPIIFL